MSNKNSYLVEVREALCWTVRVEADSRADAETKALQRCAKVGVSEPHAEVRLDNRQPVMAVVRDVARRDGAVLRRYAVGFDELASYSAEVEAVDAEEARVIAEKLLDEGGCNPPFEMVRNEREEMVVEEVRS